jgi:EAL domain-containing protein (putative c-di-GMP-specific phosphodiesterase class I)
VIDNAIRQIAGWGQKIPISINVSPWDLEQSEFIANLRHACDRYNVSISKVSLEITERAVASNLKYYESVLAELSSLHVALKIDDFGTGDSSLRRLLDAPWDTVKIDRSLIPLEASDHARTNICRAIVGLCSDLNIQTIAEGIETEEQLQIIRELGVNGGQGFYFAKPVPPEEIKV